MATISHHAAIIYVMVTISAADGAMSDRELRKIGDIVRQLPIFEGFGQEKIIRTAQDCAAILNADQAGLETVIGLAREALSAALRETAFACAVEIAAVDDRINREERRTLEIIQDGLGVERLTAAAIERAAQIRYVRHAAIG